MNLLLGLEAAIDLTFFTARRSRPFSRGSPLFLIAPSSILSVSHPSFILLFSLCVIVLKVGLDLSKHFPGLQVLLDILLQCVMYSESILRLFDLLGWVVTFE